MPGNVLFVCIFNIKRSVVAEHLLRRVLSRADRDYSSEITVGSAGYMGREISEWFTANAIPFPDPMFNRRPPERIRKVMADRGIDISGHCSRPVDQEILNGSDLIIPLLEMLKNDLISGYPEIGHKILLPKELMGNDDAFLWEDTTAVPNDSRMFDFAHNNEAYVTSVINEIEGFIEKAFYKIVQRLL